ncbi:TOMM precursor leader peptide-binding protein [Phycicoccus sp. BSK3Z-2]|uniref:TOMM leader peptide-binding protein n=1 Tax=Phycicoccus avicenniae TaxID=2828860 RepID=A0A941D6T7_9MICO|nr:TOMM precursor leader peptide-binding protein [Phycicoccus avicenniae]MBR7742526.1 TOMM precursor leader peptide-binding protein [Phycicoccus avicenniae]
MRLKARPDLHHAPLPDGVYVSSGTGEFALSGWSGFADLLGRCLPLLGRGADEDELVTAIGTEKARPAVRHLVGQLEAHDMVLRLDALGTEEPDGEDRARHAELLAYLECRSSEPYAAFEEILSARVLLVGPDAALTVAGSALRELGISGDVEDTGGRDHDVAVTVLPRDRVGEIPPRARRVLPVVVGERAALVGPLVHDLHGWRRWRSLVERTLDRDGPGLDEAAGTAVAVSSAVHLLLQDLASVAGPDAYVVAGETLAVQALDLPRETGHDGDETTLDDADDEDHDADLGGWLVRLTDPWVGPAEPLDEDTLPQMPVALRRVRTPDGGVVVADGPDQRTAAAAAVLAVSRRLCGGGSAGASTLRWLLDGALRALADRAVGTSGVAVGGGDDARLAAALEAAGASPRLTAAHVPGLTWVLVRCALPDGRSTTAWGPDMGTATRDALSRAVAVHTLRGHGSALLGAPGTAALRDATPEQASALAEEIRGWLVARGFRLVGRRHPADPHVGAGPVHHGRVRLVESHEAARGPEDRRTGLQTLTALLTARTGADPVVTSGWEHDVLEEAVTRSRTSGRPLVPVRTGADAVVVGPLWSAASAAGCPACAETRRRTVLDHVLGVDLRQPATPAGPAPASLLDLAATTLRGTSPPREGEVLVVGADGVSRHHVLRHPTCPWCAPTPGSDAPQGLDLLDAPVDPEDPTRVAAGTPLLDADRLAAAVDDRYGPVRGILREEAVPYAMSMAVLAGGPVMGHGRALSFDRTRSVAVLEAYERLAGFPYEAPVVTDRTYREVAADAVDPLRLGRYSPAQLAHPSSKVEAYHPDLPLDWAWGVDLASGRARLVPAEVGFYQYDHAFKRDLRASRSAPPEQRRRVFLESSSGCALGSTLAEAVVHALFEVAERDAFLLAWHRGDPLPEVPARELADPVVDALVALVESRGLDVHFLRATQDVDLPVVWVLAVSRDGTFPASFTSAGSGADPVSAARSGLREVAQLATMPLDWDEDDARALVADSWRVRELEDHVRWSSAPEALERVTSVLGGPQVSLAEAFPGWPARLRPHDGSIRTTLGLVAGAFADAGLGEVVVVDQSTREHRDQELHVVKTVVPGTVPMVFGQAHQRLLGIPRLEAALAGRDPAAHPHDPHPFP